MSGVRNSVQRDEKQYATISNVLVPRHALEFAVPGEFDLEEAILSTRDCDACALIASQGFVDKTLTPRVTMRFLGKTGSGLAASTVILGKMRTEQDVDVATCTNARTVLPHDDSMQ